MDFQEKEDAQLDQLLGMAGTPLPPEGMEDRILAAILREPVLKSQPWYKRSWVKVSAAAACLLLAASPLLYFVTGQTEGSAAVAALPAQETSVSINDDALVDAALASIEDDELVYAICCVSTGTYSVADEEE